MNFTPVMMMAGALVLVNGAVWLLRIAGFEQAPLMVIGSGAIAGTIVALLKP